MLGLATLACSASLFASTMSITGHPYNVDGGGEFNATLSGPPIQQIQVYCVDFNNYVVSSAYNVNISTMSNLSNTRYGTTAQGSFTYQNDGFSDSLGNAANRYLLAGWLITQYNFNTSHDTPIQDAIWELLDASGTKPGSASQSSINTWLKSAFTWETTAGASAVSALSDEIRIYTDTAAIAAACSRAGSQEMMNLVEGGGGGQGSVPEPGTVVMLGFGLGMIGLGVIRRRRQPKA
jgi:hypothetical protein